MRSKQAREAGLEGQDEIAQEPAIRVLEPDARIELEDRAERWAYELQFRGERTGRGGGVGWMEFQTQPDGRVVSFAVSTAEVMAVCDDGGRLEEVAAITRALALWFEAPADRAANFWAARLRDSVEAGYQRQRHSVRALQARILERLVAGETLTDMCERAGFVSERGRPDTTWIQRRAGLVPIRCNKTGKVRRVRTANAATFARLVRAVDADPHEFGV